jgi:malonyl CoA-acyl carrier protein transacylase
LSTAVIFPAFVNEYTGAEEAFLLSSGVNFSQRLEQASLSLNIDLTGFDFKLNNFLNDEEKTQYISYIFSCTVADFLTEKGVKPSFISGYSMGIYSALYYCRSVSYNDGLKLITNAWKIISSNTTTGRFGMGMIIGLEERDLLALMKDEKEIGICNRNNTHTFIISGALSAVENVLAQAKIEGALKTSKLAVSKPYHSSLLKDCFSPFSEIVKEMQFLNPVYSYISALDQRIIESGDSLKNEVILNLSERMNWMVLMTTIINKGAGVIFECGAGDGLTRNSRFIEGDFKSYSINRIEEFIKSLS